MEALGWGSFLVLFLTLSKQLHTQWKTPSTEAVSIWLYIGQFAAEIGFVFYSWSVQSWVFMVANAVLLVQNALGLAIVIHHRKSA